MVGNKTVCASHHTKGPAREGPMSPVWMLKPPVSVYINACRLLSALLSLSQFGRGRLSLVAISLCALSLLFGPCRLSKFTLARPHTNICKISRLWGAVSSLALNESLSNFVIFLIFGALFSGVNGFSRTCPYQKLEKKCEKVYFRRYFHGQKGGISQTLGNQKVMAGQEGVPFSDIKRYR